VEEAHLEHVVDTDQHLLEVEGLADKILRSGFQGAELLRGLCGDHEDGQVTAELDFLQALHHLEAVHPGHLEVEQDQVVVVDAVELADL
jgi:hypothetical protein